MHSSSKSGYTNVAALTAAMNLAMSQMGQSRRRPCEIRQSSSGSGHAGSNPLVR